jgi:hypothetical protein
MMMSTSSPARLRGSRVIALGLVLLGGVSACDDESDINTRPVDEASVSGRDSPTNSTRPGTGTNGTTGSASGTTGGGTDTGSTGAGTTGPGTGSTGAGTTGSGNTGTTGGGSTGTTLPGGVPPATVPPPPDAGSLQVDAGLTGDAGAAILEDLDDGQIVKVVDTLNAGEVQQAQTALPRLDATTCGPSRRKWSTSTRPRAPHWPPSSSSSSSS